MLDNFFKVTKFIPKFCVESIYDIDFIKLYEEGKRFILSDVDNTLIPYDVSFADDKLRDLFKTISNIGFKLIFVSNNSNVNRIRNFSNDLNISFVTKSKKPLKFGLKKALKKIGCTDKSLAVTIGDQIMTDVLGSNRMKVECILVRPLKKSSEKWYTKINRKMEKHVLKRIKKYDVNIYNKIEEYHE